MAVYERAWRRYQGALTPRSWRFAVVARYAIKGAFKSRVFAIFYAGWYLPTLAALALIYLRHNVALFNQVGISMTDLPAVTTFFFDTLFKWQAVGAFLVAVILGPPLVSSDLSHDALPLYLSRPLARRDYVLGKLSVLIVLISPFTWMAGLLVYSYEAHMQGGGWWLENVRIAVAFVVGHGVWLLVVSLLTLAVSAWVRRKPVARGVLFGIFFVLDGLSEAINVALGNNWGEVIDLSTAVYVVESHLFLPDRATTIPLWAASSTLICTAGLSLLALWRKLRAHEVVR